MNETKAEKNDSSLAVNIAGDMIKVYAEEGPEFIMRMANYINHVIKDFNSKKGHSVRQNTLLTYACLELCHSLFIERDSKMSDSERSYEKMFNMEVANHKNTQELLSITEKKLKDTEKKLAKVQKEYDDFVKEFDAGTEKE
jgi:hypothetical protein